jgi:hypothetical protein
MCPFQILGTGSGETKAIFGADRLQALILALHILPTELKALIKGENGSFTSAGDQDLGLSDACRVHLDPTGFMVRAVPLSLRVSLLESIRSFLGRRSGETESSVAKIPRCSFCSKTEHDVRKLIAGPTVYICDECIDLCNDILAEESDQKRQTQEAQSDTTVPEQTPRAPFISLLACILCRLPKEAEDMTYIPDRGLICGVCLNVIRVVTEAQKEP